MSCSSLNKAVMGWVGSLSTFLLCPLLPHTWVGWLSRSTKRTLRCACIFCPPVFAGNWAGGFIFVDWFCVFWFLFSSSEEGTLVLYSGRVEDWEDRDGRRDSCHSGDSAVRARGRPEAGKASLTFTDEEVAFPAFCTFTDEEVQFAFFLSAEWWCGEL